MPCYMCKTKTGPFQRLEVARLRFIRKAQPDFKDDSYLCQKCFKQFESIYKSKSKSKSRNETNSTRTSISDLSPKSVSTNTNNSVASHITAIQRPDDNNNSNSENQSVIHFDSRSIESGGSNDTMDKIVQMAPNFLSLRDSTRKTVRNAELTVARQDAEAAVNAAKRQRILQPPKRTTPATTSSSEEPRNRLQIVDEDSDEDLATQLSPTNLAHVRPVVRRRREPVVQQFDDIMDLYIARTSGG